MSKSNSGSGQISHFDLSLLEFIVAVLVLCLRLVDVRCWEDVPTFVFDDRAEVQVDSISKSANKADNRFMVTRKASTDLIEEECNVLLS